MARMTRAFVERTGTLGIHGFVLEKSPLFRAPRLDSP